MQRALVTALASCAARPLRPKIRRFLAGLSLDELQFLAEFLGAAALEGDGYGAPFLAERIPEFRRAKCACEKARLEDQDHKTLVLLEYLRRSGLVCPPKWRGSGPLFFAAQA